MLYCCNVAAPLLPELEPLTEDDLAAAGTPLAARSHVAGLAVVLTWKHNTNSLDGGENGNLTTTFMNIY